jgi:hypothetical protein
MLMDLEALMRRPHPTEVRLCKKVQSYSREVKFSVPEHRKVQNLHALASLLTLVELVPLITESLE